MISYAVIDTAPTAYPVSVDEIKTHAIIEHFDDDYLIENYLKAAITELDPPNGYLGRAMMEQTVIAYLKDFPGDRILLPFPPLISVTSVKYQNKDGVEQIIDSSEYEVITGAEPGYIAMADGKTWPTDLDEIECPIWITFKAGYTSGVPEGIRLYIMLMVSEMYRQRELSTMAQVKPHWHSMIEKYRFHFAGWE